MSKKQTRRTVSMSGRHYAVLKALCALQHRATSAFVEDAIGAAFNLPGHKIDEIERRLAEMTGTLRRAAASPPTAPEPQPRPTIAPIRIPPPAPPPNPRPPIRASDADAIAAASRLVERKPEMDAVVERAERPRISLGAFLPVPPRPVPERSPTVARPITQAEEPVCTSRGRLPVDGEVKRPPPGNQVMW